jgi:hypothetical protein
VGGDGAASRVVVDIRWEGMVEGVRKRLVRKGGVEGWQWRVGGAARRRRRRRPWAGG